MAQKTSKPEPTPVDAAGAWYLTTRGVKVGEVARAFGIPRNEVDRIVRGRRRRV